jgi:hypothetical protein
LEDGVGPAKLDGMINQMLEVEELCSRLADAAER